MGSAHFDKFVNLLGDRIGLKSWDRFKGGLDTKMNTTGTDSVYTIYEGHDIMFHVSTMLPYSKENKQQIERKRHIGNDIVNIIFVDGCTPGATPSWTPSMMRTHFTHIFALVTYDDETQTYRLNIFSEESVPVFGPPLPNPPEFKNAQEFREFLLVKLINGEKAAFHSPVFAQKRQRTLEMLLNAICTNYGSDNNNSAISYRRAFSDVVIESFNDITTSKEQSRNDAHMKYGQMLKLNTIIRGDAPTSSITSGQSKRNPWQPKLIHKYLQHEVICGDVWNDQLIVSTEHGTFNLKGNSESESPILLIDKSVEVKQMEIGYSDLLVIRYEKGRESRIGVVQLNCLEFGRPIDRAQMKKLSLEKTKGCHLFCISKSHNHPLKLAVALHRRVIIFHGQLFTGRSLSSWNQFAQTDAVENFQVKKDVHMAEPVQTISFMESIPGGRLCIGYRNQFVLLDERSKETIKLYRTEGTRNQVVCALELFADDEHEMLLCFTRTCHFQRLNCTSYCNSRSCRVNPLLASPPEGSASWTFRTLTNNMETSTEKSVPTLTQIQQQHSHSSDSPSCGSGSLTENCSPTDPNSFSPNFPVSPTEEKSKVGEFDFAWNFEPHQVVVSLPYIFGFSASAIEIRLLINGSLVHTMFVSDCHLIASKGDLYFTSTSETLDYEAGIHYTSPPQSEMELASKQFRQLNLNEEYQVTTNSSTEKLTKLDFADSTSTDRTKALLSLSTTTMSFSSASSADIVQNQTQAHYIYSIQNHSLNKSY